MSNLAATDITVTVLSKEIGDKAGRVFNLALAFGDGALTYPAGGIPLSKAALGCPNVIDSLVVYDKGTSGYEWSFDRVNSKLVALQTDAQSTHTHTGPSHVHDILIKGGQAASTSNDVAVYTALLGKEAATDATILGANSATSGGIVAAGTGATSASGSFAAAALAQPSAVAIAAQTLKVRVIGW